MGVRRHGFPLPPIVPQPLLQRLDPRLPFAISRQPAWLPHLTVVRGSTAYAATCPL